MKKIVLIALLMFGCAGIAQDADTTAVDTSKSISLSTVNLQLQLLSNDYQRTVNEIAELEKQRDRLEGALINLTNMRNAALKESLEGGEENADSETEER